MAETGGQIGKYQILGELGRGAMGVVYKAQDPNIRRLVALKTLALDIQSDTAARERFYREAQAAGNLDHPNIVTIYEMGQDRGTPFIAMEFVEGVSLDEILASGPHWPLAKILDAVHQILDGLSFAHQKGVIHRDIKPANIRVRPDGRAKIVDFGIARLGTSEMTRTGTVLGTISYMSPEQLEAKPLDGRSDLFAVGCILYELLTGRRAFSGETLSDIMAQILTRQPEPVSALVPNCPAGVQAIVSRALEKDRQRRYATAEEMAGHLARELSAMRQVDAGAATPIGYSEKGDASTVRVPPTVPPSGSQAPPSMGTGPADERYLAAGKTVLADPAAAPAKAETAVSLSGVARSSTAAGRQDSLRTSSSKALIVVAALVTVVGLALVVYWYRFRDGLGGAKPVAEQHSVIEVKGEAAATRPAEPAGTGSLSLLALPWAEVREIRNTRTGAQIETRNEVTPVVFSLPAGNYEVKLVNPYFKGELVIPVEVQSNHRTEISPTMPGFDYKAYVR